MKIPIKEAIDSGIWFNCRTRKYLSNEEIFFRLRVLSFEKIRLEEVDDPHEIELDEGVFWLMRIEVVSLNKKELEPYYIKDRIILTDQDGFEFHAVSDNHLTYHSKYAKITGLNRFAGWSDIPYLKPKIKAKGAVAFLLPNDDEADYFLSIDEGSIEEA